ncbi:alpha-1-macroglobulin-like isoform X2 [Lytechinus variegatus]|nr:alpha-1-macroglobulin-like isoform X2 [Lytechinus variegatus]
MLAGTTEKICVDLPSGSEIELAVTLEEDNYSWLRVDNDILAEVIYQMNSERECFEFEVPMVRENRQRCKLIVDVRSMPDSEESCNRSKSVMVTNDNLQTLIQTDKPIYKPGQPVKFRMMSVDKDFKPSTATVPLIYIETPNDIRLAQWVDVEPNRGLVDLDFPMTSEPLLGDWTIKVEFEDRKAERTFRVEEYVLPKFEITVESKPSYILLTDTSIDVKICARYTYGQPVRGNMMIKAEVSSYRNSRPISLYEEETGSDGCTTLAVDLTVFELRSYRHSTWNAKLKIKVDVTDAVTGESLSHTADVAKVSNDALSIRVNTPSTFKPGVPFYGTVNVNYPDGTPAGDKFIMLSAKAQETGNYRYKPIFSENFTSPASGVIEFTIPDIDIKTTSLSINAEAPGYSDRDSANNTQYLIYNPYDIASLSAQYSPSGSFIQIEPIREKLVPGSTQNLNIFFTTDTAEAEDLPFQFVFMSLGDLLDVPVSEALSRRRRQVNGDGEGNANECEGDLVFNSCSSACPLICGQNVSEICTLQCVIGCACPNGLYRDSVNGTSCMALENCTTEDVIADLEELSPLIWISDFPDPEPVNITEPGQLHNIQRSFEVTADMSPITSLLVYYIRDDGEVVADSITFTVEETFANEVTLDFGESEVKPNDETTLDVTADPDSLCGVGVVDKSVYVLGGDNSMTKDSLFDSIRRYQLGRYGGVYDYGSRCPNYYRRRRRRSSVPWYGGGSDFDDASAAFKNIGLVYLTNLDIETKPCVRYYGPVFYTVPSARDRAIPVAVQDNVVEEGATIQKVESGVEIRSYFPETFLWDLVTTDESGSASIDIQAPHTITDWVANAFCLSPENGLGVAPATSLITFQPFFLSFSLPYSVIRGENVPVKISVFNYLDACLVVRVTLAASESFTLVSESDSQDVCVCGGQADSVEFRIVPLAVGQIPLQVNGVSVVDSYTLCGNEIVSEVAGAEDTVRRELFVKAEGVPEDYSWSSYFCLADYPFNTYTQRVSVPTYLLNQTGAIHVVPDSVSGKVIVTGDMLGPSLENLEHLIRLPTGCGEQNMLGFVPNIVALEYLTATNQLTDKNRDKEETLKRNMRVGYQRELNYRHRDGSFSAFGESDESGNTWLTAFVVRSLAQASKFIYVDKADMNVSMAWLKNLQDPETGCIRSVGHLGYKAMMGGVSSESMLTAYVIVTYLEAGLPADDEGVVKGLECVLADLDSVEDTYALAQIAYALALAETSSETDSNLSSKLDQVLTKLNESAVSEGDLLYWNSNRQASQSSYRTASTSSINIEINSYMILTQFLRNTPDVARQKTSLTVRWLIKYRGAQGGYGSTQDTVMGLTALGKFAANTDPEVSLYVDAKLVRPSGRITSRRFFVNDVNRRQQSEYHFDGMLRFVNIRARESGCALIQIAMNYNVMPSEKLPSFALKNAVEPLRSKKGVCSDYRITISVSYNNDAPDEESNMALVTVVPPSGFYPIKSSLESLADRNPAIKRHEIDGEKINFYFDSLDEEVQVFSFDVTKEFDVEDVKPGYISATDYYEQSLTKSVELEIECDPEAEPIDDELVVILPPVEEESILIEIVPPPPPPPQVVVDQAQSEGEGDGLGGEGEGEGEVTDTGDPGQSPESQEGTPFPGFGFQGSAKDDEQNVSKPAEAVEDKDTAGQDKQDPESKDTEAQGADEGEKEGDTTPEGDADKPAKATDETPAELKTDAVVDKPKNETDPSVVDEGPMATDEMVTEIIYVEEIEGIEAVNGTEATPAFNATESIPAVNATEAAPAINATESIPAVNATEGAPAVNATEAAPAVNATEAAPAVNATEAAPAVNATEAAPAVNATEAAPAVNATEAAPAVNATEAAPAVNATEAAPAVNATEAAPAVNATEAAPAINATEAAPAVNATEAAPAVNATEAAPAVNATEAAPAVNATEAAPAVNATEAAPAVNATEAAPAVNATEAAPALNATEAAPAVNATEAAPAVNATEAAPALNATEAAPAVNATEAAPAVNATEAAPALNATEAAPAVNATEAAPAVNATEAAPALIATEAAPAVNATEAAPAVNATEAAPAVNATEAAPAVNATEAAPAVNATEAAPALNATEAAPAVNATEAAPAVNATEAAPAVNATEAAPALNATEAAPAVNATEAAPAVNATEAAPALNATEAAPAVNATEAAPAVNATEAAPAVNATEAAPAVNATEAAPAVNATEAAPAVNATEGMIEAPQGIADKGKEGGTVVAGTEEMAVVTEVVTVAEGTGGMAEGTEVVTVLNSTEESEATENATAEEPKEVVAGTTEEATQTPSTPPPPTDFDECTVEDICPAGSECFNFPGTYECRCMEGYTEDEDGSCHDCPRCEEVSIPEDGMDRFCSSNFVYIVKRRANDVRLLREKRYTDVLVAGRVARDYEFPDSSCGGRCDMFEDMSATRKRFIIMMNATDGEPLSLDRRVTFLPFNPAVINALDDWRSECP